MTRLALPSIGERRLTSSPRNPVPSRADVHLLEAGLRREDTAALERPDDYHALFHFYCRARLAWPPSSARSKQRVQTFHGAFGACETSQICASSHSSHWHETGLTAGFCCERCFLDVRFVQKRHSQIGDFLVHVMLTQRLPMSRTPNSCTDTGTSHVDREASKLARLSFDSSHKKSAPQTCSCWPRCWLVLASFRDSRF